MELGMDINMIAQGGASMDFLHVLFFIRPTAEHCKTVAVQIRTLQKLNASVERYNVYFTPCKSLLCEQILEDEGVLDFIDFGEYQLNLVPLEKDVVSLELEGGYRDIKLHGDNAPLNAVTDAVMKLQRFFGTIPNVKSIGPASRDVCKMMCRSRMEHPDGVGDVSSIDTLVMIDREVDLVTPLVTPLTYEGLIDELIGVKSSVIKVPRVILGEDEKDKGKQAASQPPQNPLVSLALNSNDKLYAEIRGLNIEKLGPYLGAKAKVIRGQYDQFRANKDASITEIHDFVKLIPGLKENYNSLNIHINLTEELKRTTDGSSFRSRWNTERSLLEGEQAYDLLEDMIAMQQPPLQILRLLCLQSLTNGGITSNKFDLLRREIIQVRLCYQMSHYKINNKTLFGLHFQSCSNFWFH
jgi:vacuolar protein sorting-associated protein 33A